MFIQTAIFGVEEHGPGQMTKCHQWDDTISATDWIAFVESFNPVSATILN